ncbi:DUF6925 family protein [Litoribacillus peritrichatus]|uniref:Uncharacterized protein n=1 Tax=Litoribacillus peritrichatus TaxID=718191 RepID=A0ABP7N5P0_9GAMM
MKSLILEHLNNHQSSWSLGTFGALGEFLYDEGEERLITPNDQSPNDPLTIATSRGALRIENLTECTAVAYETSRKDRDLWGQAVAFCLPESSAKMHHRETITELGPDQHSILEANQADVLFDLGLKTPYVDVCIRTSTPELITALRAAEGTDILAEDNVAFGHILKHHPHRAFLSRIGRLEVYQPIGIEKSPEGPHTHVLPKLLASGLHHPANSPIPKGLISGLMLYPASPCFDAVGNQTPFDLNAHQCFQQILKQYGLPDYLDEKERIIAALNHSESAGNYPAPANRLRRLAARIALRQRFHVVGDSNQLQQWRTRFDRPENKSQESQPEHAGAHE